MQFNLFRVRWFVLSVFAVTVWVIQPAVVSAQGKDGVNGSAVAVSRVPVGLFSGRPMLRAPGFYGIEAASGDMETRGLAQGEPTLRLELPDGATVDLENDDIERRGPKDLAWRGWIAGDDDSEAVLTLKNGLIFGRLRSGTDVYELRSRKNGRLRVEKIDPAMMPDCDTDSHLHARDGGGLDTGGTAGDTALASAGDGSVVIDLLAVYSNDARDGAGGVAEIEALIQAAVDAANAAFINSDMTARYRLVHVAHVDHDTWGTTGDDLDWVTDSSEVASHAAAVVVKRGCNTRYVAGRWIAGYQSLDQANRDEWTDVFVVENIVQRGRKILIARLASRNCYSVERLFGAGVVKIGPQFHRRDLALGIGEVYVKPRCPRVGPASIDMREAFDYRLVVGGNLLILRVEPWRTILIQLEETNRKQLH